MSRNTTYRLTLTRQEIFDICDAINGSANDRVKLIDMAERQDARLGNKEPKQHVRVWKDFVQRHRDITAKLLRQMDMGK
jgi:hypothetical protein